MEGQTPDPPASPDGPVLHVLGQLQHLQLCLGIVTETEAAPQGQGELIPHTASTTTQQQEVTQRVELHIGARVSV